MPHAFKLQLPSTGLNYNVESVCIYRKGKEDEIISYALLETNSV